MKYIISEEELNDLLNVANTDGSNNIVNITNQIIRFKESHRLVELVETGRIIVDENNKPKIYTLKPDDHFAKKGTQMGSLYKIYTQKVKE